MIQRIRNTITINTPDLDLSKVTNILTTFEQRTTGVELTYTPTVVDSHTLSVTMPKDDAMKLDHTPLRGQVMFTINGAPQASKVFSVSVNELLKEDGYGS